MTLIITFLVFIIALIITYIYHFDYFSEQQFKKENDSIEDQSKKVQYLDNLFDSTNIKTS